MLPSTPRAGAGKEKLFPPLPAPVKEKSANDAARVLLLVIKCQGGHEEGNKEENNSQTVIKVRRS